MSPVYDLNPVPASIKPRILATSIDFSHNEASLKTAFSVIAEFRLSKEQADSIVREVAAGIMPWKETAKALGIPGSEIKLMTQAFEHRDWEIASSL
jgi:serine/threonine-protein kinase HipA